jgi:hypothetical protein
MSNQNDMLKMLYDNNARLKQTETREVPGNIPGFTSFYDTGTFTPTLVGAGTAGTFTYDATNTIMNWSRIGNRVFFQGRVRITAIAVAPTGNMSIRTLPFTSAAVTITGAAAFRSWVGFTLTAGYTQVALGIGNAQTEMFFIQSGSNLGALVLQGAAFALVGGAADFQFEGHYQVA